MALYVDRVTQVAVRDTSSAVNRVLCRQGYLSGGAGYILSREACFMSTGLPKWRCGIHPQQGSVLYVDRVTQVAVRDTFSAGKRVLCRQGYPSGGAGYILSSESCFMSTGLPKWRCGIHPQQGSVFYVDRVTQVAVRDTSSAGKRVLCRQGYPSGGAAYILSSESCFMSTGLHKWRCGIYPQQ